MLKSFIGFYSDFICNFNCIKNIACFQKIIFVSKKCSPYSRFSNSTGKIYYIFFGLLFIFLRILFRGTYLKKNCAPPERAEDQPRPSSPRPVSFPSTTPLPPESVASTGPRRSPLPQATSTPHIYSRRPPPSSHPAAACPAPRRRRSRSSRPPPLAVRRPSPTPEHPRTLLRPAGAAGARRSPAPTRYCLPRSTPVLF